MEKTILPIEYHDLPQYLRDLREHQELINRQKTGNEYFGIRFRGGQRANFYSDIDSLLNTFEQYKIVQDAHTRIKQDEVYKWFEVVKFTKRGAARLETELERRKKHPNRSKASRNRSSRKYRQRGYVKRKEAQRQREYRAGLKGAKLEAYKKAARKRAKKSTKKMVRKA